MACHAAGIATHDLLQTTRAFVLWLVPSNAIRDQTLRALKNDQHPYRRALEEHLGPVTVMTTAEALYLSRPTADTESVVIVATLQSFRVEDTEGRKVYESSGALMSHFEGWPAEIVEQLERTEDGKPVPSLANLLRLRSPIVIVDEAHNARTPLSFDTLTRFRPACILEFTATPARDRNPSNVLYSVSAAELKAEEMIKLPIVFFQRPEWKELLTDAIAARNALEHTARMERQHTGEYIRPIMLIQAQPKNAPAGLTVDVVREALKTDFHIPDEQIKEATGANNELYAIEDITDEKCPVRYIITIQALREGWDCAFAYVLCSVAELRATTAVEQILGRVLRMPRAKRKQAEPLNRAHAYVTSSDFHATASALREGLIENGFERQEVDDLIVATVAVDDRPPMFGLWQPAVETPVSAEPDLSSLPADTAAKVSFDPVSMTLKFSGEMSNADRQALAHGIPDQAAVEKLVRQYEGYESSARASGVSPIHLSAADRGEVFSVPLLAIKQGNLFEPFENTHFTEEPWSLAKKDALLTESEFASTREQGKVGQLDIGKDGVVVQSFLEELRERQLVLISEHWDVGQLIAWLERYIPHVDLETVDLHHFLERMIRSLMDERSLSLDFLVHNKIQLRAAVEAKIAIYRASEHKQAYNMLFAADPKPFAVSPDLCFTYRRHAYPFSEPYKGSYKFNKHYYTLVGDLKPQGEEFECAMYLDQLPEVEYWVRNLARQDKHSFWLQTSTDRFYPDFVCKLKDGRILVVEYKSAADWSNDDNKEKRHLGQLWEALSEGKCLFIMPQGKRLAEIAQKFRGM